MTLRDFYVKHFTAVMNEQVPVFSLNSRKLKELWNNLIPIQQVSDGYVFTEQERQLLMQKMKVRINDIHYKLTDEEIENKKSCLLSCVLFHDWVNYPTYEIKEIAGNMQRIKRVLDSKQETGEVVIRDKSTGEELIIKDERV